MINPIIFGNAENGGIPPVAPVPEINKEDRSGKPEKLGIGPLIEGRSVRFKFNNAGTPEKLGMFPPRSALSDKFRDVKKGRFKLGIVPLSPLPDPN